MERQNTGFSQTYMYIRRSPRGPDRDPNRTLSNEYIIIIIVIVVDVLLHGVMMVSNIKTLSERTQTKF